MAGTRLERFTVMVLLATLVVGYPRLLHSASTDNKQSRLPDNITNLIPTAVIGSGPAGYSAALYTVRAKIPTVIFAGPEPRGTLNQVQYIENWPGKPKMSGSAAMEELEEQVRHFGANILYETIKRVDFNQWPFLLETNDGEEFHALSVIIATGGISKKLDVPGANEYWGKGVGACTICDAPFNKGHDVIIVGGGDTAVQRALQISAYAKQVTMLVPEKKLSACPSYTESLKETPNIMVKLNCTIDTIKGNQKTVTSATVRNIKSGQTDELPVRAVYFAIGYTPQSEIFKPFLATDKDGYIIVKGRSQKTSVLGVSAAGNVVDNEYRKTGVATGQGICAGMDTISFLESLGFTAHRLGQLSSRFYTQKTQEAGSIDTINSNSELEQLILTSEQPIAITFFSPQCPFCVQLMPATEQLAHEMKNELNFYKLDAAKNAELVEKYSIVGIPTIIIFNNGKEIQRITNIHDRDDLKRRLTAALAKAKASETSESSSL